MERVPTKQRSVYLVLAATVFAVCVLAGGVHAQVVPPHADKSWGDYKVALGDAGFAAGSYLAKGTAGNILSLPEDGDGIQSTSPEPGETVVPGDMLTVTLERYKVLDYGSITVPLPFAEIWFNLVDPNINFSQIVHDPSMDETTSPTIPGSKWWDYVLIEVRKDDKNGALIPPGTELPLGETIGLIVKDPPGPPILKVLLDTLGIPIALFIAIFALIVGWRALKRTAPSTP